MKERADFNPPARAILQAIRISAPVKLAAAIISLFPPILVVIGAEGELIV